MRNDKSNFNFIFLYLLCGAVAYFIITSLLWAYTGGALKW